MNSALGRAPHVLKILPQIRWWSCAGSGEVDRSRGTEGALNFRDNPPGRNRFAHRPLPQGRRGGCPSPRSGVSGRR